MRLTAAVSAMLLASSVMGASVRAAVQSYDFTVNAGPGGYTSSAVLPYGLSGNPILTGSFTVDNAQAGSAVFTNLSYVTGTRSWSAADIDGTSSAQFDGMGALTFFDIRFTAPANYVISNNTMQVNDGSNFMFCNFCVSFAPSAQGVPEPASWALMIFGFGASGAMLRRPRPAATVRIA